MDSLHDNRAAVTCALVGEAVRTFGEIRLRVAGISMLPSLWPGDILLVRRCRAAELQPGQIVQYMRDGLLIAHRIAGSQGSHWLARGDRNVYIDPPLSDAQILGRVVWIERHGRKVDPGFTSGRRLAAWFLQRSDLLARILLRLRMAVAH
jgi:signal peptidase I